MEQKTCGQAAEDENFFGSPSLLVIRSMMLWKPAVEPWLQYWFWSRPILLLVEAWVEADMAMTRAS